MNSDWIVDIKTGRVRHRNGFVCLFYRDKITDIKTIPENFSSHDIKAFSDEAIEQYSNVKEIEVVE